MVASSRKKRVVDDEDEEPEEPEELEEEEEEEPVRRKKSKAKGKQKARQDSDGDDMEVDQRATGTQRKAPRGASDEEEAAEEANPQLLGRSEKYARNLADDMLNNLIKDTARLAIYMQNKGKPINKTDIKDKVLKDHGKAMEYVIEKARELLREIFGLDMELLPVRKKKEAPGKKIDAKEAPARAYALKSTLNPLWTAEVVNHASQEADMGFISLLLCLIYVSGGAGKGSLSELSLKSHLNKLGMETDSDVMGLGDLHKLLQKASSDGYIVIQKVTGADGTAETSYIWGPRAKVEFPEDSIVDLIASFYPNHEDETLRANIKKSARVEVPQAGPAV